MEATFVWHCTTRVDWIDSLELRFGINLAGMAMYELAPIFSFSMFTSKNRY